MNQDNVEELLAKVAQFLDDEQEIYGPFRFSRTSEIINPVLPDSEIAVKSASAQPSTDEKTAEPGSVTEPAQQSETVSQKKPQESEVPEQITLQDKLDACKNLDDLRVVCENADELRTDLGGTNLVFGVGNPNADLMLIGEAPGEQEDKQGEPFVGAAGQLLNKILSAIQFKREDVYIANILKHRPPGNRNPSPEERLRSLPYLLKQIELIQPKVILCLGKVSGTTLLNRDDSLKNMRGQFYPFRNSLLTVTYHPAALLRNPHWKRPTWEDVQKVRTKYDELTANY